LIDQEVRSPKSEVQSPKKCWTGLRTQDLPSRRPSPIRSGRARGKERDGTRAAGRIDQLVSAGEKIPGGNENRIPAGDGNPFSLREERIPGRPGLEPWDGTRGSPRSEVQGPKSKNGGTEQKGGPSPDSTELAEVHPKRTGEGERAGRDSTPSPDSTQCGPLRADPGRQNARRGTRRPRRARCGRRRGDKIPKNAKLSG
jgi:hypothetical protein